MFAGGWLWNLRRSHSALSFWPKQRTLENAESVAGVPPLLSDMSGFTALNVEPEDNLQEEVDDTKEIQLEEAFKLYQNALRLHSQGPEYYTEAWVAYKDLFDSEVFKYPEVTSGYAHDQIEDDLTIAVTETESEVLPLVPGSAAETSANSIPLLVYLSFKNRGQFYLDVERSKLQNACVSRDELCCYYAKACNDSLKDFADGLERDDTDLDLWKKAARVADILAIPRVSRFCLESVLAGDDEDFEQTIDLSGLDEAFAAGELQSVLKVLEDDLSSQRLGEPQPRSELLDALRVTNDPFRFLPPRAKELEYLDDRCRPISFGIHKTKLQPLQRTLLSLGKLLLQTLTSHQDGTVGLGPGAAVAIELPQVTIAAPDNQLAQHSLLEEQEMEDSPQVSAHATETDVWATKAAEPIEIETSSMNTGGQVMEQAQDSAPLHDQASIADDHTFTEGDLSTAAHDMDDVIAMQELVIPSSTSDLPTRKRSSTIAGNEEPEARTKSKRLRARESLVEAPVQDEEVAQDMTKYYQDQLWSYEQCDIDFLNHCNDVLSKLELRSYGTLEDLKRAFWHREAETTLDAHNEHAKNDGALSDLKDNLTTWSDERSQAMLHGHGSQDYVEKSAGLTLFLQHSKAGVLKEQEPSDLKDDQAISAFAEDMNARATNIYEAAFAWLLGLLKPHTSLTLGETSSYVEDKWSTELKETVVQLLVKADEQIFKAVQDLFTTLVEHPSNDEDDDGNPEEQLAASEAAQAIFELHLDINSLIRNPSSQVDQETRLQQSDRVSRWSQLASDFVQAQNATQEKPDMGDQLRLRFLWASVLYASQDSKADKTHIMACLEDLREILVGFDDPVVTLPNNAAMPQISISAVEQEMSRLSTLDFFMSVFDSDNSDAVAVIMKLEPILEQEQAGMIDTEQGDTAHSATTEQIQKLIDFLESGDAALKLFLWRRLQNAYTAISYTPKVVSCQLRAIETIVQELTASRHLHKSEADRQISMLKWLRDADELVSKVLTKALNEPSAFESLDEHHVKSSLEAVVFLVRLLHGFAVFEDSVRVGQIQPPTLKGASSIKQYEKSKDRLREMLVRLWTLQYMLVKEAMHQSKDLFETPDDVLARYLRYAHHALGPRQYCRASNKVFVRLAKTEFMNIHTEENYSGDIALVLFDMYQLRFAPAYIDETHRCPPEVLDKKTATALLPFVMHFAKNVAMKDLIKAELKATIEKIQHALGTSKSTPPLSYNKKLISAYLKSPIHPNELYRCIKGIGDLPTRKVQADTTAAADLGWYFLLGHLSLAKYRSVKRVNPTPTDDLDVAAQYLRTDLEHSIEKWETWYRLAQVYEAKIEDDLIWNSTKLNESRADIATNERVAIHSYSMATAIAMRNTDDDPDTARKISDMFIDFASRLYSSSRPPLNMDVFKSDKYMRHLSSVRDNTMSKEPYYKPMRPYSVWLFAAYLLRRKMTDKPKPWLAYYTLGKCLWKMFQTPQNSTARQPVTMEQVLAAFIDAIDAVPRKERSTEYILEPHFKLVSTVHKMVHRHVMDAQQGVEVLQATRYANGVRLSEDDEGNPEWEAYILLVLKKLSNADKSNWHHRIIARAAHVLYDDQPGIAGALGAKHQFTQQIFTKTMTLQVWKPEFERPGRHYVYTGRYVLFFVHLLDQLNDRSSLDQLLRRIRRKNTDFIDHPMIWEKASTTYLRLLRRVGKVPEGKERALFDTISFEEFSKKSGKLEQWAHDPDTTSVLIDIMRDAIELKKLNNSLMKGTMIDDLIGDTYACIYEAYISQLPPEEQAPEPSRPSTQDRFINLTTENAPTGDDSLDRMRMGHLLSAQGDGTAESPYPAVSHTPIGLGLQTPTHRFLGTPPPATLQTPEPVRNKPGRTKTITRREVQRKAEAVIGKPPPIKTPTLSKKLIVEIPSRQPSLGGNDNMNGSRYASVKDEDGTASRASSKPPSVHDSADMEADADDESELSDVKRGHRADETSDEEQDVENDDGHGMDGKEGEDRMEIPVSQEGVERPLVGSRGQGEAEQASRSEHRD